MRPVIILLGVLAIGLAMVCLQQRRTAHKQLAATHQQTESTSNALIAAQTELTTLKARQAAMMNESQQQLTALTDAKSTAE
jgi:uncharacterized protein HemX